MTSFFIVLASQNNHSMGLSPGMVALGKPFSCDVYAPPQALSEMGEGHSNGDSIGVMEGNGRQIEGEPESVQDWWEEAGDQAWYFSGTGRGRPRGYREPPQFERNLKGGPMGSTETPHGWEGGSGRMETPDMPRNIGYAP